MNGKKRFGLHGTDSLGKKGDGDGRLGEDGFWFVDVVGLLALLHPMIGRGEQHASSGSLGHSPLGQQGSLKKQLWAAMFQKV